MNDFVRARTEDQFNIRREMILNACDEIYTRDGIMGVTFNTVAAKTSFTRPALYNYYKNREAMLMDLLIRETKKWDSQVSEAFENTDALTREEFCKILSDIAEKNEKLLKLTGDLCVIEAECQEGKLLELKKISTEATKRINEVLMTIFPDATQEQMDSFYDNHLLASVGIYQLMYSKRKVYEAMKANHPEMVPPNLGKVMYNSLMCATSIFKTE